MNTSITAPDGDYLLTTHESGMARLWKKNRTEPLQEWIPAPGHEIAADFTPDGKSALIAGTESGIILVNPAFSLQQLVIAPPGPPVRFLTINPAGDKAALARVDGLEVIPLSQAANTWHSGTAQSRCAAAWSADGSRIAMAAGGRREAVILAAENGDVCTTVAVTGMPQHLAFHPDGSLLAIAADDGSIAICETATGTAWTTLHLVAKSLAFTVDGESLRVLDEDGTTQTFPVSLPTAFHEWSEAPRAKADGAVLGMSLSPDGSRALTTSTECIAVWSVKDEHQTGYYLLENQRTDARVSAWWLGDREILLQVPGGLERLAIDSAGKPGESTRVPKVPGSVVLDVRTDGSWIVSVADEEGDRTYELWPGGNPEKAVQTPAPPKPDPKITASHPASGTSAALTDSGAVEVRRPDGSVMRLIPPLSPGVKALLFSQDGRKLILLTRTHRVFSWDLEDLASALDANGL